MGGIQRINFSNGITPDHQLQLQRTIGQRQEPVNNFVIEATINGKASLANANAVSAYAQIGQGILNSVDPTDLPRTLRDIGVLDGQAGFSAAEMAVLGRALDFGNSSEGQIEITSSELETAMSHYDNAPYHHNLIWKNIFKDHYQAANACLEKITYYQGSLDAESRSDEVLITTYREQMSSVQNWANLYNAAAEEARDVLLQEPNY